MSEPWECARCHSSVLKEPDLDKPEHELCHVCASVVLDDVLAAVQLVEPKEWQGIRGLVRHLMNRANDDNNPLRGYSQTKRRALGKKLFKFLEAFAEAMTYQKERT